MPTDMPASDKEGHVEVEEILEYLVRFIPRHHISCSMSNVTAKLFDMVVFHQWQESAH
jgi:hypothetical protein